MDTSAPSAHSVAVRRRPLVFRHRTLGDRLANPLEQWVLIGLLADSLPMVTTHLVTT